jgi:hypothetical protein
MVDRPVNGETFVPATIPTLILTIIESGFWFQSKPKCLFCDIVKILKQNNFVIKDGGDSAEVSEFVSRVESSERLDK